MVVSIVHTQVLNNLVSNAIKHTMVGSISIIAGWQDGIVKLEVKDTGPVSARM